MLKPSGAAEPGPGGWKLTGSWGWSSGCDHVDWLVLVTLLPSGDDARPEPNFCLVPRNQVSIDDYWQVMGLAGTGSKTVSVGEAFVPAYRTLPGRLAAAGGVQRGQADAPALYRLPHPPCVSFLLVTPSVGIAESLLEIVTEEMKTRASRVVTIGSYQSLQLHSPEWATEIDSARLLMMRDTRAAMDAKRGGEIRLLTSGPGPAAIMRMSCACAGRPWKGCLILWAGRAFFTIMWTRRSFITST